MESESCSTWNNGREAFSTSIQNLPAHLSLRRGILDEGGGRSREVDVKNLGFVERRNLLQRLVKNAEEDNERFLLKLKERIDRVGLDMPTIEVRFEHLNVEAQAYVGSRALPTMFNFSVNILEGLLSNLKILPTRKKPLPILKDVSGIIKPGRMALLLGPPSSGKTTLLLALAGKLSKDLKFSGRVSYNGHGMEEFVPQRTSAYVSQYDLHIREMTVRETLAFSARCQGVGPHYEMLAELCRREKEANIKPDPDIDIYMKAAALEGQEASVVTDYVLKILGLEVCADTMVGDVMVRGISGGQKKRLTIGEMLVGPARALFMDEISTAYFLMDYSDSAFGKPQAVISKETLAEKITTKTGENAELSSRVDSKGSSVSVNDANKNRNRGMILPFEPLSMSFDEIKYAVDMPQEMKAQGNSGDRLELLKGEMNGIPKIKDGYNPATWMLEVTSAAQEEALGVNFTDIYKNSELCRRNKALVKELSSPAPGSKRTREQDVFNSMGSML
ncbi:hypothetical protein V6N13_051872 [Hibiscus sabdariffa]